MKRWQRLLSRIRGWEPNPNAHSYGLSSTEIRQLAEYNSEKARLMFTKVWQERMRELQERYDAAVLRQPGIHISRMASNLKSYLSLEVHNDGTCTEKFYDGDKVVRERDLAAVPDRWPEP